MGGGELNPCPTEKPRSTGLGVGAARAGIRGPREPRFGGRMEGGLQEGSQGTGGPASQMLLPSPHPGHSRDPHGPSLPTPSPPDGLSLLPCEASSSTGTLGPSPLACSPSCTEHVPSCKHSSPSGDGTPIWLYAGQRLGWPPPLRAARRPHPPA